MLSPNSVHVDQALTNVSVQFRNAALVAPRVAPEVTVQKQSDKYHVWGKEDFRVLDDRKRAGAVANEAEDTLSTDAYFCDGHALRKFLSDEEVQNADTVLSLDIQKTRRLTSMIMLAQEDNLATQLAADMTGASQVDLVAAKWDDDTVDPIKRIYTEKETIGKRIGVEPNKLLLSAPVFRGIRNNAKVTGRITGSTNLEGSRVTAQALAELLEIDEVIVGAAKKDTAAEGQAASLDYIWGKTAILFYAPAQPSPDEMALAYTFLWNVGELGRLVKRYRDEPAGGDWIEVLKYYALKTVSKDCGTRFINAVA
jgi:hypothetical protein